MWLAPFPPVVVNVRRIGSLQIARLAPLLVGAVRSREVAEVERPGPALARGEILRREAHDEHRVAARRLVVAARGLESRRQASEFISPVRPPRWIKYGK